MIEENEENKAKVKYWKNKYANNIYTICNFTQMGTVSKFQNIARDLGLPDFYQNIQYGDEIPTEFRCSWICKELMPYAYTEKPNLNLQD